MPEDLRDPTAASNLSRLDEIEPPPKALRVEVAAEPPVMAPELSMTDPSRVTSRTPPMLRRATSMVSTMRVLRPTYLTAVSISES